MSKKLHKRESASLPALLWLMLLALLPAQLSARDFEYTYEEQTLTYTVLSENEKKVSVSSGNRFPSGDVVIPSIVSDGTDEYTVTEIGNWAFLSLQGLTHIDIPNSVTSIGIEAFKGCISLESIDIPNSVIIIGGAAFSSCQNLRDVEIPNSVTWIDDYTFYDCYFLGSVIIPNSVKSIGREAFAYCRSLGTVIIPSSVTSVGYNAFNHCDNLRRPAYPSTIENPFGYMLAVEYPANRTFMEDGYIWGNDKTALYYAPMDLEGEFIIPNSVTSIGSNAFSYCGGLTSVIIPNSVTSIGEGAFRYCGSLIKSAYPSAIENPFGSGVAVEYPADETCVVEDGYIWSEDKTGLYFVPFNVEGEYTLPASVASIGNKAFEGCGLTTLNVNSAVVPVMGSESFAGLYDKCQLNVPDNLFADYMTTSNWHLFENVNNSSILDNGNFKYRTNPSDGTAILLGPTKTMTEATILAKVSLDNKMYTVTSVGADAFNGQSLNEVTIRNGIEIIGDNAFYKSNLRQLVLPESVKRIGNYSFAENTGLTSVTIGSGVESIGDYAFYNNYFAEVVIPSSVKTIGKYAFAHIYNLKYVTIGSGIESISDYAFYDDNLYEVVIPSSVKTIGKYAFAESPKLKSATIGLGVESIGDYAFYHDALAEVVIPAGVQEIGEKAFAGNENLSTVIFSESADKVVIDATSFDNLTNLTMGRNFDGQLPTATNIEFGNLLTEIPDDFMKNRTSLKSVKLGTGITEIPANAFKGCALSEVVIPSNVTTIGESAFENNKLTNVIIGCGTAEIGHNAFANNNSIATINVTAVEPPVATDDVFSTQNAQLNVLKDSREAYENAVCWYQFEGTDLVPISVFKILNEPVPAKATSRAAGSNGKQLQFSVSVEPANASLKDCIFWSSSNPEVATVDNNGLVTFTGATEGTSEITAMTLYDGVVASTTVTAEGSAGVDGIFVDSNDGYDTAAPNDIYNLQGVCLKRNASNDDINALAPGLYIIGGKKVLVK